MMDKNTPLSSLCLGDLRGAFLEMFEWYDQQKKIETRERPLRGISEMADHLGISEGTLLELRDNGYFDGVILRNPMGRIYSAKPDELWERYRIIATGGYKPTKRRI